MQLQLAKEKEERERAERQVRLTDITNSTRRTETQRSCAKPNSMGSLITKYWCCLMPNLGAKPVKQKQGAGLLSLTGGCDAVRRLQVSGLTKLLEGQKDASQGASGRKENRRITWCPGAQGDGDPPHAPSPAWCISMHRGTSMASPHPPSRRQTQL